MLLPSNCAASPCNLAPHSLFPLCSSSPLLSPPHHSQPLMHLSRIAWRRCTVPGAVRCSSFKKSFVNSRSAVVNSRREGERRRGRGLSQVSSVCARPASTLPDVCGLPVVTSSWKAIKSLDEAYTEVSDVPIQEHTGRDVFCAHSNRRAFLALVEAPARPSHVPQAAVLGSKQHNTQRDKGCVT